MGLRILSGEASRAEEQVDREEGVDTGEEIRGREGIGNNNNNNNPIDGTREGLGGRILRVIGHLGETLAWKGLKVIDSDIRQGDRLLDLIRQEHRLESAGGYGVEGLRAAIHRRQERVLRSLAQGVNSSDPFPNKVLQAAKRAERIPALRSRYSREPIGLEEREVKERLSAIKNRVVKQENSKK